MAYKANIPQPGDLLSQSQQDILNNFSQANTAFGTDHTPFDVNTNVGFHKPIHMLVSADPGGTAGTFTAYSKSYTPNYPGATADTQMFGETAGATILQLSGTQNATNLISGKNYTSGFAWVGGILLVWGEVIQTFSAGRTRATTTFQNATNKTIPFPNKCFIVFTTPLNDSGSLPSSQRFISISIETQTTTSFDWLVNTDSSSYTGFNWIAIGN